MAQNLLTDSMNFGERSKVEKHGFGSLHTLLGHVTIMRIFCFDTDFVSQMELSTLPLTHCFVHVPWRKSFIKFHNHSLQGRIQDSQ